MLGVAGKVTTTISDKAYFPFLTPKRREDFKKDFKSVVILKTRIKSF